MKRSCELQTHTPEDMYGGAALPELIPPALQPSPVISYSAEHGGPQRSAGDPPRRVNRPPKLGQIGRSKRVDIDDEDLDDIMNNNRSFPLSINVSPVA